MADSSVRRRVLILCTGNSCRSQMAQGWVNHVLGDRWQAQSAGTKPAAVVHPLAVRVMAEIGVDIHLAEPRSVDALLDEPWDVVVTVCDSAKEVCPVFPRPVEQVHVSFPDPADAQGSEEERLVAFRAVRDDIRARLLPELEQRSRMGQETGT
jgi:arsenate reductase (thioredoxin)